MKYVDITIFKMAAVSHFELAVIIVAFCIIVQNFAKI